MGRWVTCGKHAERTICLVESRDNRELAPTTGVEGGTGATEPGVWQSVTTMPWAWLSAGLIASALFAGGVALFSTDPRHRLWGQAAVGGYALAALAVMTWRSRQTRGVDLALAATVCGAILFPLLWLIAHGYGEPEVGVVATSARELIQDGTPYRSAQALAATTNPNSRSVPAADGDVRRAQALLGHGVLTDPRVWFGAVFLATFAVALRIAGARNSVRWALLLTASPIIAFELCVGGTDVPMVAFMCLGFALLSGTHQTNPLPAGAAFGIACSMKATAWPALVMASRWSSCVTASARPGGSSGSRSAWSSSSWARSPSSSRVRW